MKPIERDNSKKLGNLNILPIFTSVDGMSEMNQWLIDHNAEEISFWEQQVLLHNPDVYPPLLCREASFETITLLAKNYQFPQIRQKIINGMIILADRTVWQSQKQTQIEYNQQIFCIAGFLRIESLNPEFTRLASGETLKKVKLMPYGHLHRYVLSALSAIGCNQNNVSIFERDIQEIEYAGICFRTLWKFNPTYAAKYTDQIFQFNRIDPDFPSDILLKEVKQSIIDK
jgi:hypothetical protein